MKKFLIYIFVGFLGGIIRCLVSFAKNKTFEKTNHFKPSYFVITILISAIIAVSAQVLADTERQVLFLA